MSSKISQKPFLSASTLFLLTFFTSPAYSQITVITIDVGQGDCVLIQSDTHKILIDAGWGYDNVADYLADKGISRINKIVATHGHADHIGGLVGVLQRKDVDKVLYNGQTHTTLTFERFVDAIAESEAAYHEPSRCESFELGDMTLEILHPEGSAADYEGHLHDNNIVARIVYGDFAVIISGDIEQNKELEILESGVDVSAQILELGHHGSSTSSHPDWIEAVDPELAFWQAGEDNQYGHPHDETLSTLERLGVETIGTATHGTITITAQSDGIFEVESQIATEEAHDQHCIDLNQSDKSELNQIIHIGEGRAQAIKQGRPWQNARELTEIRGIG